MEKRDEKELESGEKFKQDWFDDRHDYETGYRISECYAKLAKTFAKTILKKAK